MKTLLTLLSAFIAFTALAQTSVVNVAWDYTGPAPSKFTLYQQPHGSATRVKMIDNIAGTSRAVAVTITNSVWYTLTMTTSVQVGATILESLHSNALQFQFAVPPAPIIRLQ